MPIKQTNSLLEKAKAARPGRKPKTLTTEQLELATAWLDGELTLTQVTTALNVHTGSAYVFLAMAARELWNMK